MKWCILINNIDFMMEFFGKMARQMLKEGDECLLIFNSKIAEYNKAMHFPENVKKVSKVDWLVKNYKENDIEFNNISWKEFFATFERKSPYLKLDYANSVKIISQLCQFFKFVFKTEKPDIVINEAPGNIFTEVAYHYCKNYGIKYLGFIGSRFKNHIDIYDLKYTCSKYQSTFEKLNNIPDEERVFAKDFLDNFLSHKEVPSYTKYNSAFLGFGGVKEYFKRQKKILPQIIKYLLKRKVFKNFDYESEFILRYHYLSLYRRLKKRIKQTLRIRGFRRMNNQDKFFLYPLQFYPEASTLAQATYFSDQLNAIKNIAFSLPFPCKLYVKEHPVSIGTRQRDFYKKIRQIPNVVLISPFENVQNLIQKSQGVITLTSTVGMEAALAGKPVYVLGEVFYSYHPLCQKINSFEELKEKIYQNIVQKTVVDNSEEINVRFILSYFKNTIEGDDIVAAAENDSNDYQKIYQNIKRIFLNPNEH